MAGNYQNGPGPRMAWDADGTFAQYWQTGAGPPDRRTSVGLTAGQRADLNSERFIDVFGTNFYDDLGGTLYLSFLFPEGRDIDGIFATIASDTFSATLGAFESSDDTTNGRDGTWSNIITNLPDKYDYGYPRYRDEIQAGAATDVDAVRVVHNPPGAGAAPLWGQVHLYGSIPAANTPNRIIFLDTANGDAEFVKPLDYEEIPRGRTDTRTIKLKNISTTAQANTVQITSEDLWLNAGTWYEFSDDDVTYQATLQITSIAAEASELVYVRQVIPSAETLGTQTGRFKVSTTSFT